MTRLLLLATAALGLATAATAQMPGSMPGPASGPPTITVSGEGLVSGAPDRAMLRLGVTTRAATAAEALRQHEADMSRVLTTVRRFGIADRDITIEALSLGDNYGPNGPDGYLASRIVTVTIDDLARVPEIVAAAVGDGANRLDGLVYTVRDMQPLTLQALDLAVADARRKAERLARAAGVTLGPVVMVQETPMGYMPPPMPVAAMRMEAQSAPAAYSAGSTLVRSSVTVQFAIAR